MPHPIGLMTRPAAASGGGGGWTPASLTGLVAWYDASNSGSITQSGGLVSQWNDLSGNGYHLTQGTGANQPTTGTRTINSVNVLDFDGTNDYLESTSFTPSALGDFTVYAVILIDTSVQLGVVSLANNVAGKDWDNAAYMRAIYVRPTSSSIGQFYNGGDGANAACGTGAAKSIATLRTGTTLKAYVGGSVGTDATGVSSSTLSSVDTLRIGCASAGGATDFFNGTIAEVAIAASGTYDTNWNSYVARWGL